MNQTTISGTAVLISRPQLPFNKPDIRGAFIRIQLPADGHENSRLYLVVSVPSMADQLAMLDGHTVTITFAPPELSSSSTAQPGDDETRKECH